jgi:flagellar biosynthesis/type III secretory pathway chaperone
MNTTDDQVTLATRLLFANDLAPILHDEISTIYESELSQARDRTILQAKSLIAAQLEKLPVQTFGIVLDDVDLESLATGFMPFGVTLN